MAEMLARTTSLVAYLCNVAHLCARSAPQPAARFQRQAMLNDKVEKLEATVAQLKSTVAKQEATIAQQQKGMDAVTVRLNEQASQIQKVSAQLEATKPARQVVNNP